jgi:hypothetical protein
VLPSLSMNILARKTRQNRTSKQHQSYLNIRGIWSGTDRCWISLRDWIANVIVNFDDYSFETSCNMRYIGNANCKYNARSPHLRCAINPDGPCEGCPSYAKVKLFHPSWGLNTNDKALRVLLTAFVGLQFGILIAGIVIIPIINQVIKLTIPASLVESE